VDLVRRFDVGSLRLDISANIDDLKVFASNRLSRTLNGILSSELRALAMSRILQATDGMYVLKRSFETKSSLILAPDQVLAS
jgi:hypothetical protein